MTHTLLPTKTLLRTKDVHTESEGWEKIFQANGQGKKPREAILTSYKIVFKTKATKRDTEGHFIILEGRIYQESMIIVNIYTPNTGALKYIRKILGEVKKDIDSNTLIVGDFNTPLSTMDKSSKQRINKDIMALNNALD